MPIVYIVIGIAAIGGLVLAWPTISASVMAGSVDSECRDLERQLIAARAANDLGLAQQIQARLSDCARRSSEAGGDYDPDRAASVSCDAILDQMALQWRHFKTTDYADILKRGNQRSSILNMGAELVACFQRRVAMADRDEQTLLALNTDIRRAYEESLSRITCYMSEAPGCGRYLGSVEDAGNVKAMTERSMITIPLLEVWHSAWGALTRVVTAERERLRDEQQRLLGVRRGDMTDAQWRAHMDKLAAASRELVRERSKLASRGFAKYRPPTDVPELT